jgi:hypothetical protein
MTKDSGWRKRQVEELKDEFFNFKEAISGEKFEAWRQEKIKEVANSSTKKTDKK